MQTSLNLKFVGETTPDQEFPHPPGATVARNLRKGLQGRGWSIEDIDNWRDVGWSLECSRRDATLEIAVCGAEPNEWVLQVAPLATPGIVGRWMGKKPSASVADIHALAREIHAVLSSDSKCKSFRWCWDELPDDRNSTSEPPQPLQS